MNKDLVVLLSINITEILEYSSKDLNTLLLGSSKNSLTKLVSSKLYEKYIQLKEDKEYVFNLEDKTITLLKGYSVEVEGWQLDHENSDGSIIASLNGKRRYLTAGKYILSEFLNLGKRVSFKSSGYNYKNGFFHVYGNYIDEVFPFTLCRIYFNVRKAYLLQWLSVCTQILSQSGSYFNLKFIVSGNGTRRADNSVLYIKNKDFNKINNLLLVPLLRHPAFFHPETPLFTLKLANGIAFAENPPNPNDSFGTNRCRNIAEAMINANENREIDKVSAILEYLKNKEYDICHFHLNPNTKLAYDFSNFKLSN